MERKLRITVDGRAYIVTVEDLSEGNLPYPPAGYPTVPGVPAYVSPTAPTAPTAAAAPAPPPGAAGAGDVVATLGGMVESVLVSVGQEVSQGETVVVLEAMKMNTPMAAPRAGKVTAIAVRAGQAVEVGQLLATIA